MGGSQTLEMDGDWHVTAEFVEGLWTGELDLLAALETLLLTTGEVSTAGEVLTFDRGDGSYVDDEYVYSGNGIPDAAELLLVEELVINPHYAFARGVWGAGVHEEFEKQWEFIALYLVGQDEEMVAASAVYLTIGGTDYLFWLRSAMGLDIDYNAYGNLWGRYLHAEGDADGDGFKNLEEWAWVMESEGNPPMSEALAEVYVLAALDASTPPSGWTPGGGGGQCGCWNNEFIPFYNLTVVSNGRKRPVNRRGGERWSRSGYRVRIRGWLSSGRGKVCAGRWGARW